MLWLSGCYWSIWFQTAKTFTMKVKVNPLTSQTNHCKKYPTANQKTSFHHSSQSAGHASCTSELAWAKVNLWDQTSRVQIFCETQPPASISWLALSSFIVVRSSFRIRDTSSHLHYMMFQTIQTIYFLWGYDPGNMSVSFIAVWAQFTIVYFLRASLWRQNTNKVVLPSSDRCYSCANNVVKRIHERGPCACQLFDSSELIKNEEQSRRYIQLFVPTCLNFLLYPFLPLEVL